MRELIFYPNRSKGGVTTVIRGRAAADPGRHFDAVFLEERGGATAFDDLPNVESIVIRKDRSEAALKYLVSMREYERASVLSSPETVSHLAGALPVRYEFHSSDLKVVKAEIDAVNLDLIDEIAAPSEYMAEHVRSLLPKVHRRKVIVIPNLVDEGTFSPQGPATFFADGAGPAAADARPLVWVGRLDRGKGYRHFVRAVAALPENFYGIMVISLESGPDRVSAFLNECAAMGVQQRIQLYLNLPQQDLASLYRWARDCSGLAVSTSLLESFGYFVAEANACGLPVVAFELPVWREHKRRELIESVPIGSVHHLVQAIRSKSPATPA